LIFYSGDLGLTTSAERAEAPEAPVAVPADEVGTYHERFYTK
jgi:hypothetical protein